VSSAVEPQDGPNGLSVTDVGHSVCPERMHRLRDSREIQPQLQNLPTVGTFKLSILMPAHNAGESTAQAVAGILAADYPYEIELIVIDDGSTDRTAVLLSQINDERLIVHRHEINQGKRAALHSAASLASGTHILPLDVHLEYAAEDIPKLLEPRPVDRGLGTATTIVTDTSERWPRVSVVVPALNEARNLPHVFARMPLDAHEVILVDGHSVDGTVAVARQLMPDVRVVRQTRTGKGNALACGFAAATGDIIAMVDADGSADPREIPQFVDALLNGADFAKGSRFIEGGGSSDLTRLRSAGNRALTGFFNACYRSGYSDLCYGFNVFWRRHAPALGLDATSSPPHAGGRLWGDGFEIETLIHVRAAKAGLIVAEVPSFEHPRIHGASNLNTFHDGLRVLRTILAERRRTRHSPAIATAAEPALRHGHVLPRAEPEVSAPPALAAQSGRRNA
jgi:glycosyltransferase involved in cell wall biosynthesis